MVGRHDIAEILLKVALNTKNQIKSSFIGNSSDKLRILSLQNWLAYQKYYPIPPFLSIISYLRHIFLYTLGIADLTA